MSYGELKIDTITFTAGGVDASVSVSGLVQNPTFTGNITTTGTISGDVIRGNTVSGATVTGDTGEFGNLTAVSGVFTTQVSGATVTGDIGLFGTITGGIHTLTSGVFASGTQTNPSITFVDDLNTGIYSPGADQVAVATNGTGRLFVDASGRVGVGTASPSCILDVQGGSGSTIKNLNAQWVGSGTNSTFRADGVFNFQNTSGTEYLRITSGGLVGIGTTSPGVKFEVHSGTDNAAAEFVSTDARVNIGFADSGSTLYSGLSGVRVGADGDNLALYTANSESARIDSSGRLLVGTSTSIAAGSVTASTLQVSQGATGVGATLYSVANAAGPGGILVLGHGRTTSAGLLSPGDVVGQIRFAGGDGVDLESQAAAISAEVDGTPGENDMPGRLVFSTTADAASSTTERMRIDSSGNVGIGTTSPARTLHVQGDARVGPSGGQYILFAGGASNNSIISRDGVSSTSGNDLVFATGSGASAESMRIDTSGRLLVGTSSTSAGTTAVLQGNSNAAAGQALIYLQRGEAAASITDTEAIGTIAFADSGSNQFATISCAADANAGTGDYPGRLVFSTTADGASSPTERMRISNNGRVGINDSTAGYAELLQVDGTGNTGNGYALATKVGVTTNAFHVRFSDSSGIIGSITSNGGTVAYNPFLGCHWARLENGEKIQVPVGTIIETVDKEIEWNFAVFDCQGETKKMAWNGTEKPGETVEVSYGGNTYTAIIKPESVEANVLNKHVCVKVNDTPNAPGVFGVFFGYDSDEGSTDFIGSWNDFYVAAVGNYFIRIAAQETVQIGDLISSDGTGCGVVQATDAITSKTVAKVTSTKKHTVYQDGSYLVTCVLYCG
jgi:hypothetical protein